MRGRSDDSFGWRERMRETKPSFATTEFWAMILGLAAVVVIYNVSDDASLDLWRACLLGTIIGTAYIVSRGLAKSGSHDSRRARDDANRY